MSESANSSTPRLAPVLLTAFNRPDLFARVLEAIRAAGPRPLFVAVDGPRTGCDDDAQLCARVVELATAVDWAPSVRLKAETKNLGCGPAITSAITWALAEVEEIIVIEDDCLPDPSFLYMCDELLERYADDERVMHISACNWGAAPERFGEYSYAFVSYASIQGWATWRRAWALNDYELESWPRVKASGLLEGMSLDRRFLRVLARDWDTVWRGGEAWDYQWQYSVMRNHGLSICPSRNLLVNLGFREDGTMTRGEDATFTKLPLESMEFPLMHPPEVARNAGVESVFSRLYWQKRGWPGAMFRWLVRNPTLNRVVRFGARRLIRPV